MREKGKEKDREEDWSDGGEKEGRSVIAGTLVCDVPCELVPDDV